MIPEFYYLNEFQATEQGGGIQVEPCGLPAEKELRRERSKWLELTGQSTEEKRTEEKQVAQRQNF